jgi:hypothetical protein
MLIFTGRCRKVGSNSKRREIIPGCSSSQGDAGRLDRLAARGERSYLDAHLPGEMKTWTRLDRIAMTKVVHPPSDPAASLWMLTTTESKGPR